MLSYEDGRAGVFGGGGGKGGGAGAIVYFLFHIVLHTDYPDSTNAVGDRQCRYKQ